MFARSPSAIKAYARQRACRANVLGNRLRVDTLDERDVPSAVPSAAVRHEVVLIDQTVPDNAALLRGLATQAGPNRELTFALVRGDGAGLDAVDRAAQTWGKLDAIHVVAHAESGSLWLGGQQLTAGSLNSFVQLLKNWAADLQPGGDLLFYGCNLAAGSAGQVLLADLRAATGLDIAASTDATGAASLGGNWKLEFAAGAVETQALNIPLWRHLLGPNPPVVNSSPLIVVTGDSFLVSADNNVYRINSLTGAIIATYATGVANDGATFAPDGSLYVADYANKKILHFSPSGTLLSRFSTNGNTPQGLTFGPDGWLYVTTTNNTVEKYDLSGGSHTTFITAGSGGLSNAKAIVWGPDGNAYVSSYFNNRVIRYNGATGAFMNVFATGSGGFEDITFGPDGNLYVASYGDGKIYRFNGATGASIGTFASGIATPYGLRFDPNGNLDVSSRSTGQIRKYDGTSGAFLGVLAGGLPNPAYITSTTSLVTTSAAGTANFQIALKSQPTADVTIILTSSMPNQGTLSQITLTFTPANWNIPQNVAILGLNDGIANGDQNYQITVAASSNDPNYSGIGAAPIPVLNREVASPNRSPVANNDNFATQLLTVLTVPATGVLWNDTDPDGDALTAVLVSNPSNGTLTLNPDGSFRFTPAPLFLGADSFTYRARDTSGALSAVATVVINVTLGNSPPVAGNDSASTLEDTVLNGPSVLANDTDPDGDTLTATLATGPAHGTVVLQPDGRFTYTPAANFYGTDSFTYVASDGNGGTVTGTVTIDVIPVNDAPSFQLTGNPPAVDEDSGPQNVNNFAFNISTGPGPGPGGGTNPPQTVMFVVTGNTNPGLFATAPAISTSGRLTYTPAPNAFGTATITVVIKDSGGTANGGVDTSAPQTFVITVRPINDPPTLDPISDQTVAEDVGPQAVSLTGISAGPGETQQLTVTATSDNPTLIPNPVIAYTSPNAGGSLTFIPASNANGSAIITVTVSDGVTTVTQSFKVTVTPVNDAPKANPDNYSTGQNTPLTVVGPGVLANDTDVDGDPLSATLVAGPTHGTLSLNPDGSFTYTPNKAFSGIDTFTYQATDPSGAAGKATVSITVVAPNGKPIAADDFYTVAEDGVLSVLPAGVLANDTPPGKLTLKAKLISGPSHGTVVFNADGSFTYTPDANFNGSDSFNYRAIDTNGNGSGAAHVLITVTPMPDAPVAVPDAFATARDVTLTVNAPGILKNDVSVDGNAPTAAIVTNPTNGTVTVFLDGSIKYTPNAGFVGIDTFTYQATDGTLSSIPVTVTVIVRATVPTPTPLPTEVPLPVIPPTPITPIPTPATEPVETGGPGTEAPPTGGDSTPTTSPPILNLPPIVYGSPIAFGVGMPAAYPTFGPAAPGLPGRVDVAPMPTIPALPSLPTVPTLPPSMRVATPVIPIAVAPPMAADGLPIVPPIPSLAPDNPVFTGLNELTQEVKSGKRASTVTGTVVGTGVIATAGYVFLSPRLAYWFLSALLARRTVWKPFDPLEVVYAWERDKKKAGGSDEDDESLEKLVS